MGINLYKSLQASKHFSKEEKVKGQFFTPPEVAEFIVSFSAKHLSLKGRSACDPACGDGVFLRSLLAHGFHPLGVDIDEEVINSLPSELKPYVRVGDGLMLNAEEAFDMVVGNPPFSAKYGRVRGPILKNFKLGRGTSQAIEILFLEKFVKLCKNGGIIGIILPHGIFSDIRLAYVRDYIKSNLSIIAIFSLPRNIFRSKEEKTSSKTCILIAQKGAETTPKQVMFASIENLRELTTQEIRRTTFSIPAEFLYPEFYLERNPILENLPKLGQLRIEISQGSAKYGKDRIFTSSGIPFISAKVVTPFGIDFSRDEKFIEPGGPMDNKRAYVEIGDIIFVRVGVGCIGRTAVITKENEKGIADDWIYIIRSKDSRISPYFLAFWLQTPLIQREIKRLARGVGTITIPIGLVKQLPIFIPDSFILKKCEKAYKEMLSARERNELERAREIKDQICAELEKLVNIDCP